MSKKAGASPSNSRWIILSMVGVLGSAPLAIGSPGKAADLTPGIHGFLDTAGSFTQIDVPGAEGTASNGINDVGQIVGYFYDGAGTHGFLYTAGSFTHIDVPGAEGTTPNGINDVGQIVGA